jgi:hypothetical protein
MTARRLFLSAFAAALVAGLGCSNGDDSTPAGPALVCTDGGDAAANGVNTNCGAALDAVTEQVAIVMGGPASGSTTIVGLSLDVTYDPTKLTFMPAASYTSTLFPPPALIAVSSVTAGRVIVGIQQPGDQPAVTVTPGQHVVLNLSFRVAPGATFPATPLGVENTQATTASAPISFASGTAIAYQ